MHKSREVPQIPLNVGVQMRIDFRSMSIAEPPNKFKTFGLDELILRQGKSEVNCTEPPHNHIAYICEKSIDIARNVLRYEGEEDKLLSRLFAFKSETEIKFDSDDGRINLMSAILAYEIEPRDRHEVPFGFNMYRLISNFSKDAKKCQRSYATIKEDRYEHPTNTFKIGANFFAKPEDAYRLKKSIKNLNGFSK